MLAEFGVHTVTASATLQFQQELVAGDLILVDSLLTRKHANQRKCQPQSDSLLKMHNKTVEQEIKYPLLGCLVL